MSNEIADKQVVEIEFRNKKFQKNIKQTQKSLDQLSESLKFKDSKKELEALAGALEDIKLENANKEIEKSENLIGKVNLRLRDFVKFKVIGNILDDIIDKSKAFVTSILGINNAIAGWRAYEEQVTTVGGILNNVEREGKNLSDVTEAMATLRAYTDETSFSFETLSKGVQQFTTAGIELEKATNAAMGVTSVAGAAKVFEPYKVQSAMDAISKSMATGYMDVTKWTSLTNTAGIVTTEFSEALLEAAAAENKLTKSAAGQYRTKSGTLVTAENIRNTLSDKWLTADVLSETLGRYSSALELVQKTMDDFDTGHITEEMQAWLDKNSYDSASMTMKRTIEMIDDLGWEVDKLSLKALKSSQETTTFGQAWEYAIASVKTQWQTIFEFIFGNYDEATNLWSETSDRLYDLFVAPMEGITSVFEEWHDLAEGNGGYKDFSNALINLMDILVSFKEAAAEGFAEVFGQYGPDSIGKLVLAFKSWTESLKENETVITTIKTVSKLFATALNAIGKAVGSLFKITGKLISALSPVIDILLDAVNATADIVIGIIDFVDSLGLIEKAGNIAYLVVRKISEGIKGFVDYLKSSEAVRSSLERIKKSLVTIGKAIAVVVAAIYSAIEAIVVWASENELFAKALDILASALEFIITVITEIADFAKNNAVTRGIVGFFTDLIDIFKNFSLAEAFAKAIDHIKTAFSNLGSAIKTDWGTFKEWFTGSALGKGLAKVVEVIKTLASALWQAFGNKYNDIKKKLEEGSITLVDVWNVIKKVALGFLAFSAIKAVLKIGSFFEAISDIAWAFEKRIRMSAWREAGAAALGFSAAIFILASAFKKVVELNLSDGQGIKSIGIMVGMIAALGGALWLITKDFSFGKDKGGIQTTKSISKFITAALGLTLLIKSIAKLVDTVKWMDWEALGKTGALVGVVTAVYSVLLVAMKMDKGQRMASLWSLIKIIGVTLILTEIIKKFANELTAIDQSTIWKAIEIMGGIVILVGTISAASILVGKKLKNVQIQTAGITASLIAISATVYMALGAIRLAAFMTEDEIKRGSEVIINLFMHIGMIAVALAAFGQVVSHGSLRSFIFGKGGSGASSVRTAPVGLSILGITASIALCIGMFKLLTFVSDAEISRGMGVLTKMLAVFLSAYGIMAVIQAKSSAVRIKSIRNLILTLTASIGLLLGAIWVINKLSSSEMARGLITIGILTGIISAFTIVMTLMQKLPNGKDAGGIAVTIASMISLIIAIAAITTALYVLSKIDTGKLIAGVAAISVIIWSLTGIAAILGNLGITALIGTGILALLAVDLLLFSAAIAVVAESMGAMAESIKGLDVDVISTFGVFIAALMALSTDLDLLTGLSVWLSLHIVSDALNDFYEDISSISADQIGNLITLVDSINGFKIDDKIVDDVEILTDFIDTFTKASKKYKKSSSITYMLDDFKNFASIVKSISFDANETNAIDANTKLVYMDTIAASLEILEMIRTHSHWYNKLFNIDDIQKELIALFGDENHDGSLTSVLKGLNRAPEVKNADSIMDTIASMLDVLKEIPEVDWDSIDIIEEKLGENGSTTTTNVGIIITDLVNRFITGFKEVNTGVANINWDLVASYTKAFGSITSAMASLTKKTNITDIMEGFIVLTKMDEMDIPDNFGTNMATTLTSFVDALAKSEAQIKNLSLSESEVTAFSNLLSAIGTLYLSAFAPLDGHVVMYDTVQYDDFKQWLSMLQSFIETDIIGLIDKINEIRDIPSKEVFQKRCEGLVMLLNGMNEVFNNTAMETRGFGGAIADFFAGKKSLAPYVDIANDIIEIIDTNIADSLNSLNLSQNGVDSMVRMIKGFYDVLNYIQNDTTGFETKVFTLFSEKFPGFIETIAATINGTQIDPLNVSLFSKIFEGLVSLTDVNDMKLGYWALIFQKIKDILDTQLDGLNPVITPVLDTSVMDAQIAALQARYSESLVYQTQGSFESSRKAAYQNESMLDRVYGDVLGSPRIIVNNNITGPNVSYEAQRATENEVSEAMERMDMYGNRQTFKKGQWATKSMVGLFK